MCTQLPMTRERPASTRRPPSNQRRKSRRLVALCPARMPLCMHIIMDSMTGVITQVLCMGSWHWLWVGLYAQQHAAGPIGNRKAAGCQGLGDSDCARRRVQRAHRCACSVLRGSNLTRTRHTDLVRQLGIDVPRAHVHGITNTLQASSLFPFLARELGLASFQDMCKRYRKIASKASQANHCCTGMHTTPCCSSAPCCWRTRPRQACMKVVKTVVLCTQC